MLILEQPPQHKRGRGRPPKNGQLLGLRNHESSTPTVQPQPVEPCTTEEKRKTNQERHEEELRVQLQEETEGRANRGKKRGAESEEETSDDANVAKKVCFEKMQQPTSDLFTPGSESANVEPAAIETEDIIDVETVSLTSVGDCSQREEKPALSEISIGQTEESDEEVESSSDEIIDVDGDEDDCQAEIEKDRCQSRAAPTLPHFVESNPPVSPRSLSDVILRSTQGCEEDTDEDIDVIGGSSPAPDPVIISWTKSSEGEKEERDEDVEIVVETTDYASSEAVFDVVREGELVNRKFQTKVLLH